MLITLGLAIAFGLGAAAALAAPVDVNTVVTPGTYVRSDEFGLHTEEFVLPAQAGRALRKARRGQKVRFEEFPVAPGKRRRVELERYDVYAAGSRILVTEGLRQWAQPKTIRLHYLGKSQDNPAAHIGISVDPKTGSFRGLRES